MLEGLLAGLFWGIDTFLLSLPILNANHSSKESLVITFVHDTFSFLYLFVHHAKNHTLISTFQYLKQEGKWVLFAGFLGGPIGMSFYVLSLQSIGASKAAMITSFFPAIGAVLSFFFLKEEMRKRQWLGLTIAMIGIILLSLNGLTNENGIGIFFSLIACLSFASEGVLVTYAQKNKNISSLSCLFIRQMVSMLTYAFIILNWIHGWNAVAFLLQNERLFISLKP